LLLCILVVLDTAWNPQVDLQAQDRAHRIGQTQQVTVYRLLVADSFEERVVQIAERKLLLDHFVIARKDDGATAPVDDSKISYLSDDRSIRRLKRSFGGSKKANEEDLKLSMSETWAVLRHGTEKIFKTDGPSSSAGAMMTESELDAFLDSCLMDSGGKSLPSVRKQALSESVLTGLEEVMEEETSPPHQPPAPLDTNGVRTIFDLEEISTAGGSGVDGGGGGAEGEGDGVGLKEEAEEEVGDQNSDDGDGRNEVSPPPINARATEDAMVEGGNGDTSGQQSEVTGGNEEENMQSEEDGGNLKRFPKRQRLAVKK
jgi:hypothetical protein